MTVDQHIPGPVQRKVTVRSFNDIGGYEESMRLTSTRMIVREAANFNGWHAKSSGPGQAQQRPEYSASLSSRSTVGWPRFFFLTGNGRPARVSGRRSITARSTTWPSTARYR